VVARDVGFVATSSSTRALAVGCDGCRDWLYPVRDERRIAITGWQPHACYAV
jgi:hypothetical protein